jgi:predicted ArsR family transcriptional regulator
MGAGKAEGGMTLYEIEKNAILETLRSVGWNRSHAAKDLGISVRCIRNKLKAYQTEGVTVPRSKAARMRDVSHEAKAADCAASDKEVRVA